MLCLCVYVLWPAKALARTLMRVVHAVPGAGAATLEVTSGSTSLGFGPVSFAHTTAFHALAPGPFTWRLVAANGAPLAGGSATIGAGRFTAIVLEQTHGVVLVLYRDRTGVAGRSLIRIIHAAPEFGSPSLKLDSKVVDQRLDYTKATPYLTVRPGVHSLEAIGMGHPAPLVSMSGTRFRSGIAYSEIVVGTRGQRVRVVTVTDRGAPLARPSARITPARDQIAGRGRGPSWVTIAPGDSLWRIARDRLGPGASNPDINREVVRIWDANAERIGTGDPNLIFPGTRLHMPD